MNQPNQIPLSNYAPEVSSGEAMILNEAQYRAPDGMEVAYGNMQATPGAPMPYNPQPQPQYPQLQQPQFPQYPQPQFPQQPQPQYPPQPQRHTPQTPQLRLPTFLQRGVPRPPQTPQLPTTSQQQQQVQQPLQQQQPVPQQQQPVPQQQQSQQQPDVSQAVEQYLQERGIDIDRLNRQYEDISVRETMHQLQNWWNVDERETARRLELVGQVHESLPEEVRAQYDNLNGAIVLWQAIVRENPWAEHTSPNDFSSSLQDPNYGSTQQPYDVSTYFSMPEEYRRAHDQRFQAFLAQQQYGN
jgi:hypothetical protein